MKLSLNILSFIGLLLLAITTQAQTVASTSVAAVASNGMTIFNSDNFYAQENTILVQNGFTIVLNNNTEPVAVIALNATPTQLIDFKSIKPLKASQKRHRIIVAKTQKVNDKTQSPTVITWGNSPLGNSSLYIGVNSISAIIPSTTSKKYTSHFQLVCNTNQSGNKTPNAFKTLAQKQHFQSHEIVILSSNYLKTSRVRPPPYC
jgi:hypothetical protein